MFCKLERNDDGTITSARLKRGCSVDNFGRSSMHKCSFYRVVHDRDANASKNTLHKNMQILCWRWRRADR